MRDSSFGVGFDEGRSLVQMSRLKNDSQRQATNGMSKEQTGLLPSAFATEFGLTSRESEVLSWLSKGKTNRDIAQILGLSPRTVDKHLEQIYAKLGVENRTAAAAIATGAARRET